MNAIKDDAPLMTAKAELGAAFAEAIGDEGHKTIGHQGLVSGLCSGVKVPDYLAQMYLNPKARQRFALALLNGVKVEKRLIVTISLDDD